MNRVAQSGIMKCSWGSVGYKHWNKGSPKKVFLMHGWLDNLGVYEPLVANLFSKYELFAFDLPGHGRSDHVKWPWGYSHSDLSMYFHEIWHHLGWEKYDIIAHSFSGNAMIPYLAASQDLVNSLVLLDAYGLITVTDEHYIMMQRKKIETAMQPSKPSEKLLPVHELLKRLEKSSIPDEFQSLWMERGVKWNDDKTAGYFARDKRLLGPLLAPTFSSSMLKPEVILENYNIQTLRLLGSDSEPAQGMNWEDPIISAFYEVGILEWVDQFDKLSNVSVQVLPGNHHFFLPHADATAKVIEQFWQNI